MVQKYASGARICQISAKGIPYHLYLRAESKTEVLRPHELTVTAEFKYIHKIDNSDHIYT
jgi:hypothetical protein